jgi:hypothetical protein
MILAVVDGYGRHLRRTGLQFREIRVEIRGPVAPSELDDADTLAVPGAGGEIV